MKKSDLKTGMIVTIRLGLQYVVIKDTLFEGDNKDLLISLNVPGSWMPLSSYNEDLLCADEEYIDGFDMIHKDFDIIIVETPLNPTGITSKIAPFVKTIWTRGD